MANTTLGIQRSQRTPVLSQIPPIFVSPLAGHSVSDRHDNKRRFRLPICVKNPRYHTIPRLYDLDREHRTFPTHSPRNGAAVWMSNQCDFSLVSPFTCQQKCDVIGCYFGLPRRSQCCFRPVMYVAGCTAKQSTVVHCTASCYLLDQHTEHSK